MMSSRPQQCLLWAVRLLRAAVLACVVLLLASAPAQQIDEYALDDLLMSLQPYGGFFDARLGRACDTCPRGIFAHHAYKMHEIISLVPLQAGIHLGSDHSGTAARLFLAKQLLLPELNTTYAAYLATLPGPDDVFALHTFTKEQIAMLQSPVLETLIYTTQNISHEDFHDEKGGVRKVMQEVSNGTVTPSFAQYQHAAALMTTRHFYFNNPASGELHRYLMPALELINHSVRKANVARYQDAWKVSLLATRDIQAGEELLFMYHPSLIHRADISLLLYGFVSDEDLEEPVLAASDRASFKLVNCYAETPLTDEIGHLVDAKQELARVEALQKEAEAETTLEQDQELLAALRAGERPKGTEGWTWKETEIIKFRVARKTALRRWLQRLWEDVVGSGIAER